MIRNVVWAVIFCLVAAVLQSTLLARLALYRAVPDIALIIIVYSAYINGTMTGQVTGFFYGLALDFMSAAPLGLNAFVRTIIGALAGLMKGTFFLDIFLLPMILCACATLLKALILFLLSLPFAGFIMSYPLAAPVLWAEMALTTFCAPFIFALLKRFSPLLTTRRGAV